MPLDRTAELPINLTLGSLVNKETVKREERNRLADQRMSYVLGQAARGRADLRSIFYLDSCLRVGDERVAEGDLAPVARVSYMLEMLEADRQSVLAYIGLSFLERNARRMGEMLVPMDKMKGTGLWGMLGEDVGVCSRGLAMLIERGNERQAEVAAGVLDRSHNYVSNMLSEDFLASKPLAWDMASYLAYRGEHPSEDWSFALTAGDKFKVWWQDRSKFDNPVVRDQMVKYLDRAAKGRKEFRKSIARQLVMAWGMEEKRAETMVEAWETVVAHVGQARVFQRNFGTILEMERGHPGSIAKLNRIYGINHFGRCSERVWGQQFGGIDDRESKYFLMIFPFSDWNGVFYGQGIGLFDNLLNQMEGVGGKLRIVELRDKKEGLKTLLRTKVKHGGVDKILTVIVDMHGDRKRLLLSDRDDGIVTDRDISTPAMKKLVERMLGQEVEIVFFSCQGEGLKPVVEKELGRYALGSAINGHPKEVEMVVDNKVGGKRWRVLFADDGSGKEYLAV